MVASSILRELAQAYSLRPLDDVPFSPLPIADMLTPEDEVQMRARVSRMSYEAALDRWGPIDCFGDPSFKPTRFIDGSVFSRTVAVITVEGRRRPVILACLGALALSLQGRRLVRKPEEVRCETVFCLMANGIPAVDRSALAEALDQIGIELITSDTDDANVDFETLRRRTWDLAGHRMEDCERSVLFEAADQATAVDGLLERRLVTVASQAMPVVGVVKKQMRRYLPESHTDLLYDLKRAQRTPAFLLETEHAHVVSWYLRLSNLDRMAPGHGIVRITAPREFLELAFPRPDERWKEISALSAWLFSLRHREASYKRMGISLEPIVRVEDELHALLPEIGLMTAKLHRALGV